MDGVTVISETIQEFRGENYYRCGCYFQRKGKRLHRVVWETYNGPVPNGYHVHHIDGNRANNSIDNLECKTAVEHESYHMSQPERVAQSRISVEIARKAASEWHRSEAGRKWHSEQGKRNGAMRTLQTYVCSMCGKEYQTKSIRHSGNHFCHQNCRAKYGRRKRAGLI